MRAGLPGTPSSGGAFLPVTHTKETAERALSAAQERSEVYARQRSAAEHRLSEITGELYEEVRAREQLQSRLEHLEKELQVARQSMDFYKKNLEDRCAMASDDEERLQADFGAAFRGVCALFAHRSRGDLCAPPDLWRFKRIPSQNCLRQRRAQTASKSCSGGRDPAQIRPSCCQL